MKASHFTLLILLIFFFLPGIYATSMPLPPDFVLSDFPGASYTARQRYLACQQDPVPDYGTEAYNRYDLPLMWTFQVNFDVTSDGTANGRPLGCLRLYQKNEPAMRFDEIDSGGI